MQSTRNGLSNWTPANHWHSQIGQENESCLRNKHENDEVSLAGQTAVLNPDQKEEPQSSEGALPWPQSHQQPENPISEDDNPFIDEAELQPNAEDDNMIEKEKERKYKQN